MSSGNMRVDNKNENEIENQAAHDFPGAAVTLNEEYTT